MTLRKKKVIIDTSTLIYFTQLHQEFDMFRYLQIIFGQVLIPEEIKNEFARGIGKQPERSYLLEKIKPDRGFYTLCTQYDRINMALLKSTKGIDAGEAEATAQYQTVSAHYILSDDRRFTESVSMRFPYINIISSLHIVAMIDLSRQVPDCTSLTQALHRQRPFKSAQLREAYQSVAQMLGVAITNKEISKKTSLKKIINNV